MSDLEIRNLQKVFGSENDKIVAVDDLNIAVEDGDFLVLVGPSGCGKSTTLRCIAGLETATDGEIILDGATITNQEPANRDIAMVFQNYALYPHMTARKNIAFGLKMRTNLSKEKIKQRVQDVSSMMGIEPLLDKKPKELSGGQQQRVALGRAIVREPEVFLMDEPLSNLDAKLRTQMRTELQNLQDELEITTVYVTHDQTEAMTMGDKIAILNDGELQQLGTPLECYYTPANKFVAGFIGSPSMNFFDVQYSDGVLEHEAFTYILSDKMNEKLVGHEGDLTIGIRPEDIMRGEGNEENAINTTVSVVEPLGDVTYVYIKIGSQTRNVNLSGNSTVQSGDDISVVLPENSLHIFDGETGESIMTRQVMDDDDDSSIETRQANS